MATTVESLEGPVERGQLSSSVRLQASRLSWNILVTQEYLSDVVVDLYARDEDGKPVFIDITAEFTDMDELQNFFDEAYERCE